MELAFSILVDAVITGTRPIAIAIDRCDIDSQKPEHSVQVEDRIELLDQLVSRCFVQDFAKLD